jgi:signal transduction histidine kinase
MARWDLQRRMLAAGLVWLVLAWGLGGTALVLVFRSAVVDRFDSKLDALVDGLAGYVVVAGDGTPTITRAHPNFAEPNTGWYWLLTTETRRVASRAPAAFRDFPVPRTPPSGAIVHSEATGPGGMPLRAASRRVEADGREVVLTVGLDRREIDQEIRTFTTLLVAAAIVLGLVLLFAILAQARFTLAPLRRLRGDLAEVESGRLEAVPENYPPDIVPVAEAINDVLERDRALTAWARKSAGNLAHALKTELALLRQLARERDDARMVESADRIAGVVDHHLSRATVGPKGTTRARADTQAVMGAVVASLERIFAHRTLAIEVDLAQAPDFRGELQDLEEIVGNLLENACRHAEHRVHARATAEGTRLVLLVADDGPGLDATARTKATRRGERLDEKGPGAGLGLAIVSDLAELYGGRLGLADSALGGLEVRVELPAVID